MLVLRAFKATATHFLSELRRRRAQARREAQRRRVAAILAREDSPDCSAAEAAFDLLQAEYSGVPEYGYDPYSTWQRGVERAETLLTLVDLLKTPGARILEAGCGDAMAGYILSTFGHEVTLTDLEDWRDARARHLAFTPADICQGLTLKDNQFDVSATYNSFEHFSDPKTVIAQLVRVLKPGGCLFTEFGPLFAGPWGMHAYRTLRMPFPQFLFSESFWRAKLRTLGIRDLNRQMGDLQPLNRWTVGQFRDLWKTSGCEIVSYSEGLAEPHLDIIERFPKSFQGRNLTIEDVSIQSVKVLLRKNFGMT